MNNLQKLKVLTDQLEVQENEFIDYVIKAEYAILLVSEAGRIKWCNDFFTNLFGYNLEEIYWHDYYPGEHFDIEIQNKFAKLVNAQPLRVFVSEVDPGRNVPYHWDVEDKEEEWLSLGELKRWVCFIDKPRWGNVLILENQCFHNEIQGSIYEWDNYRSHHAGTSMGIHKQYLFHFLGRPNK